MKEKRKLNWQKQYILVNKWKQCLLIILLLVMTGCMPCKTSYRPTPRPAGLTDATATSPPMTPTNVPATTIIPQPSSTGKTLPTSATLDFPQFPWPPPKASSSSRIEYDLVVKDITAPLTNGAVMDNFEAKLKQCGYTEKSYYAVPEGFALVTRLEQIKSDGSPRTGSDRWLTEFHPFSDFNLLDYLKALFVAPKGYFRLIVFVFSPTPFYQATESVSQEDAVQWLGEGFNTLPQPIRTSPYGPGNICTALIYEFEKTSHDGNPVTIIPGRLGSHKHLEKSKILEILENG